MSAPHGAAAPVEEDRQEEQAERPSAGRRLGIQRYAILIVFAAMVAGFGLDIPSTFLSMGNLSNILGSQAVLFILVMAVLLPTIMGDFVDLSLGSSLGLSAMTLAVLNVNHGWPALLACLAGIGAALLVGLVNVFFVVYFDNDPFIVTLGTMTIVQGIIYIISGDNSVGIVSPNLSNWIFTNDFLSIPLEFYYGLAIFLVVWYVLSYTPVGQKALVIGQSREVARLTGVRVNRQRSWAFIIAAGIAGVAGLAYAGTNGTVDPTAGSTLILPAYAAVFLGATAIRPGRINALGALVAVYFLATGTAGLELLGAQSYIQQIFYGAALVVAITIPKTTRDRILKRKRAA
jgi:ribose transport system permease protein